MRHTAQPLTAGDWHGLPVLFERALQRKARCMASFEEEWSVVAVEEEGSVVAVIGDLYGSAAAHHGIRDDGLVGVHGDVSITARTDPLASPSIIRRRRQS
jgi:hypothetical protein